MVGGAEGPRRRRHLHLRPHLRIHTPKMRIMPTIIRTVRLVVQVREPKKIEPALLVNRPLVFYKDTQVVSIREII